MNLQSLAKKSARRVLRRDQDERYKNEIAPECRYPVEWISKNFYIPETFTPIPLHPSQYTPLAEALSVDANGKFNYSTVVWSAIKKSAKSSIAAAVGLWFAARRPYSMIKVIANDQRQAESRVFYYMKRAIEIHPEWRKTVYSTGSRIEFPNRSFIEAVALDPKGEAGGNDDLIIYSEIWGWKTKAALQMWTETTLSPFKYGESMRWCETYAGYENDSPVLEDLYDTGVTHGTPLNMEYEMYQNTAARQFTLWNTKPMLPWQTEAYYNQEKASLDQSEFDRVHRNQWQTYQGRIYPTFGIENITDEADYNPAKGIVYWACDDGYAFGKGPGSESYHPRVVLLAQKNSLGGLDIFAEYYETGVDNYEKTIDDVLKLGYPKPEAAYIDSSAPMFGAVLFRRGIYSVGASHDVIEGIKNVRRYICDAQGVRLLRIHSRCVQLNREMRVYRHGDSAASKSGEQNPKKENDHGPDATRYLLAALAGII